MNLIRSKLECRKQRRNQSFSVRIWTWKEECKKSSTPNSKLKTHKQNVYFYLTSVVFESICTAPLWIALLQIVSRYRHFGVLHTTRGENRIMEICLHKGLRQRWNVMCNNLLHFRTFWSHKSSEFVFIMRHKAYNVAEVLSEIFFEVGSSLPPEPHFCDMFSSSCRRKCFRLCLVHSRSVNIWR